MTDQKVHRHAVAIDACSQDESPDTVYLERMLLQELDANGRASKETLWQLAVLYSETARQDRAFECIARLTTLADTVEETASYWLAMGQLSEQRQDYEGAVRHYGYGLAKNCNRAPAWYWLNNNLGYSLIQIHRFHEAVVYLRAALDVDRGRPNALKNLGLAMQGLEQHAKAAEYFVAATRTDPRDRRSLKHLQELVAKHPQLLTEVPSLHCSLDACRREVDLASESLHVR